MKTPLLFLFAAASLSFTSCCNKITLENRRDLYNPQIVNGPYTRMLRDGIPSTVAVTGVYAGTGDYKGTVGK